MGWAYFHEIFYILTLTISAFNTTCAKPGATVSMPLQWEEVKKGLKMSDFNISNSVPRIRELEDVFKPVLAKGIDMSKALKRLSALSK